MKFHSALRVGANMKSLNQKFFLGLCLLMMGISVNFDAWGMGSRVPIEGTAAADFQLSDLKGHKHHLSEYRGKVVLLNFWATWCKPCTQEMPAMQKAYDQLKDKGLVVLAVNELEEIDKVQAHIQEHGHTFPVLLDPDNGVANLYGVYGLPVSVFIDQQGRVHEYIKGGLLTNDRIAQIFEQLTTAQPKMASR